MNAITILLAAAVLLLASVLAPSADAGGRGFGDPGFDIPGRGGGRSGAYAGEVPGGWDGAYGGGESGPNGGHSWSGTTRSFTQCNENSPCQKKLRCPARCFKRWAHSGKNFGDGGGEGGCIIDCNKCTAYC